MSALCPPPSPPRPALQPPWSTNSGSPWETLPRGEVDAFEAELSSRTNCGYAAALSSSTAALHLALLSVDVARGQTVVCPTLAPPPVASMIRTCGAEPLFIDTQRGQWSLDPELLAEELQRLARSGRRVPGAVIVVDLYGDTADYDPIRAACDRFGVPVIEDASDALGSTYRGRQAGSLGDVGVLSFNGGKIVTTAGGGALVSNHWAWIDHARRPGGHPQALPSSDQRIDANGRLSRACAIAGRAQLRLLGDRVRRKREINAFYRRALMGIPGLAIPAEPYLGRSNCWLTCAVVDPEVAGRTAAQLRLLLESDDAVTRRVWAPLHLQPAYEDCRFIGDGAATSLSTRAVALPSEIHLTTVDLVRVCDRLRQFMERRP